MKRAIFTVLFIFTVMIGTALAIEQSSRITDREIVEGLTRLEEGQKYLRDEIKSIRSEIKELSDELKGFMLWGFGITFAGIFALIGFVLWDRRTAIAPVIRETKDLIEREQKIERVLKEYAREEPRLKEIMKRGGML